ncbi:hypothetical protein SAMN05216304_105231 [Bosea sp. OK403]|uniref:hypothetical protein n=1 Tax=Bosea sp. OK403 TaxID=1855286 RepID=UPI0008E0C3F3|nr:hypothetical protein [Bosea sp. OK403]SFJ19767.1 hypothetical protein SAMN05216304_105231 [Bosea sp. OK403]
MLVNFLQDDASAKGLAWRAEVRMPPFWELEELITQGHDTRTALEIIAMRRCEAERQHRQLACDIAPLSRIPA